MNLGRNDVLPERRLNVYAVGLCCASVCAPKDMEREEVERLTNLSHPTGVGPWRVADKPFRTGEPNPYDAPDCGRHWLLEC